MSASERTPDDRPNSAFAPLGDGELHAASVTVLRCLGPIVPVPADAPKLTRTLRGKPRAGRVRFTKAWPYREQAVALLSTVVRYDRPANGSAADKQILPFSFCQGPGGRREWRCKALPEPRPLFRLPELAARPDAPVLVVEGEKTVDAAAERFPDYVATTSSGGSNAARKADWTPLAGRHVTIWPDADAPALAT